MIWKINNVFVLTIFTYPILKRLHYVITYDPHAVVLSSYKERLEILRRQIPIYISAFLFLQLVWMDTWAKLVGSIIHDPRIHDRSEVATQTCYNIHCVFQNALFMPYTLRMAHNIGTYHFWIVNLNYYDIVKLTGYVALGDRTNCTMSVHGTYLFVCMIQS